MSAWKQNRVWAGAWALVALALLLAPSPREWGSVGRRWSLRYDRVKDVLQPSVHFVLMVMCGLLLMRIFKDRPWWQAVLLTAGIALGLAMGLELLQLFLPASFARSCDPMDLPPSLAGAVCGALIGLLFRSRREPLDH